MHLGDVREEILAKSCPIAREMVTFLLLKWSRLGCKCVGLTTRRGFMYRRENARVLGRMYMANFVKGFPRENAGFASECMGGNKKTYENRRSHLLEASVRRTPCISYSHTRWVQSARASRRRHRNES